MENIVFKELAQDKEVRHRLITLKSMQKDEKNREAVNGRSASSGGSFPGF